ncbi:MAG: hypothetical protein JNK87_24200 [Bryobacterales bacterium]|nr:hypothetical protein [Bryobacterales bacterium]
MARLTARCSNWTITPPAVRAQSSALVAFIARLIQNPEISVRASVPAGLWQIWNYGSGQHNLWNERDRDQRAGLIRGFGERGNRQA